MDRERDTDKRRHSAPAAAGLRRTAQRAGVAAGVSAAAGERRARIIAATMRLIARAGVAALSHRAIAHEADVSLAAVPSLVGRKDDLLLAVLEATTSAMIAALIVDAQPGRGLPVALADSFMALCALLDQAPALPLVRCEVLLYAGRRPTPAAAAEQQRYLEALEVCYRVACAEGERDLIRCEELAGVVCSSIDGLALQVATGVAVTQQAVTRAHALRGLLTLVPLHTHHASSPDQRGTDDLLTILLNEERRHDR